MIVTCEQCETQFQLDDSKVPEGGIRVRCSRCKYAFFVESPHGSDSDRADNLAREALARDSAAAPRERDSNLSGLEDGESDWQFNEEIDRAPGSDDSQDDLAAAQEAVDDLLGGTFSGAIESHGTTGASADPVATSIASRDSVAAEDERIDLGQSDLDARIDLGGSDLDLNAPSPAMEDTEEEAPDLLAEPSEDPIPLAIDHGFEVDDSAEPAAPAPAEPVGVSLETSDPADSPEAPADPLAQLGSSDDWESLTGDVRPPGGTPIGRLSRVVPEEIGDTSESGAPLHRAGDDGAFDVEIPTAGPAWISRVGGAVGWALVALLCAYTGFVGLWPRATASAPAHSAQPVPGLRADDVRGHWIENAIAGPIYVVSGELRAISAAPLPPGSLLRIHFLDADGAAIGGEPAAVGPRVSSELLREWSLRDLQDLEERGAVRLAWDPLAPGERRWFQAILGRVPTPAVAFGFEVAAAPSREPEIQSGTEGLPPAADLDPRAPIE